MPTDLSHAVSISHWVPPELPPSLFVLGWLLAVLGGQASLSRPWSFRNRSCRRSEAYLAEAQKQSHRELRWEPVGEIIWSEETFRSFHSDRAMKSSVELVFHGSSGRRKPGKQTIERAAQDGKGFDFDIGC